ncbi:MAG: hypothetical protein R2827_15800 [Bdellovibrionales bacterium]
MTKFIGVSFLVLWSLVGAAQPTPSAEVLGAKTYLEELITGRFSNELATIISTEHFKISARLDIAKFEQKDSSSEPIADLDLGFIDPDQLFKEYSASNEAAASFLQNFQIKKAEIHVGLRAGLSEGAKAEVEKWLAARVQSEFGKIGNGFVKQIQVPVTAEAPPLDMFEAFKQLQTFAGQLVLAIAALLGLFLWKLMSGKDNEGKRETGVHLSGKVEELRGASSGGAGGGSASGTSKTIVSSAAEDESMQGKVDRLTEQIIEIAPQITSELPVVLETWCQQGKEGFIRVACLAEAVSKIIGKLPVPKDYRQDVFDEFANMHKMVVGEKKKVLERVYWDLSATLNLGSETVRKPFSFLAGNPVSTVKDVLMQKNPQLRTIVSMYMTDELRSKYFKSLDEAAKIEMLTQAAQLAEIPEEELASMETDLSSLISPEKDVRTVALDATLTKIISVLPSREACIYLKEISGPVIEKYKRSQASVAFLHEWPDEFLQELIARSSNEELLAYLNIREDMTERFLGLMANRTRQIIEDDLKVGPMLIDAEIEIAIFNMNEHVNDMISEGVVDLDSIFSSPYVDASGETNAA